jgi:mannan endo-1,4-beta-mannosidase
MSIVLAASVVVPAWAAIAPVRQAGPSPQQVATPDPNEFVTREGTTLLLGGSPFQFTGINIYNANSDGWCGARLADGPGLDRALVEIGHRNEVVRAWFFQTLATDKTPGRERNWAAFDHTLQAAAAHGMKVIATLTDQWGECGTDTPGNGYKEASWYVDGYRQPQPGLPVSYRDWVAEVVTRYADDPRIAFWQLINEAEVTPCPPGDLTPFETLRDWASDVSGLIKSIDPNHLVSLGTIGSGQCGADGPRYQELHAIPTIDLCEFHDYGAPNDGIPGDEFNGMQVRIDQCNALNKPLFVGEAGIKPTEVGGTLIDRANAFAAKRDAQFGAGVQGFLAWAWSPQDVPASTLDNYDIGPGDPAFGALRGPSLAVTTPEYTEPISLRHDGTLPTYGRTSLITAAVDRAGWVVSADGSRVVFTTEDTNMVPGGTNGYPNVYVRDRNTLESIPISRDFGIGATISADGTVVAYEDGSNPRQVQVAEVDTGARQLASHSLGGGGNGNGQSNGAEVSADGRFVAFQSSASDLVTGDVNGQADVFLFDRTTGQVELVSVASNGTQGNDSSFSASVSDDGRLVAFRSWATNLVAGDTNGTDDIFVRDRVAGTTIRVSVASDGTQGNGRSQAPFVSGGHFVVFGSESTNLAPNTNDGVYVYLHDLVSGTTELVAGPGANEPAISSDGRYMTFISYNYVDNPIHPDFTVHDLWQDQDRRIGYGDNGFGVGVTGRFIAVANGATAVLTDLDAPPDTTPPTVDNVTLSPNPVGSGDRPSVRASARDVGRGLARAEMFLDADPGQGAGTPVNLIGLNPGRVDGFAPGATAGTHQLFVRVQDNVGLWSTAASISYVVSPPGGDEFASISDPRENVPLLVQTDPDQSGPTQDDPVESTMRALGAGTISIHERPIAVASPTGFTLIGQQVDLAAPPTPLADPIQAIFRLDVSVFPAGKGIGDVTVFVNAVAVAPCLDPEPDRPDPNPCVADQFELSEGDALIRILATNAGTVTFGVATTSTSAPGAPSGVIAAAGDASGSVSWFAPASDGGSAISGYTVLSSGGQTATVGGTTTTAVVPGLTNGATYTFTVTAANSIGSGPPSSASTAVTPRAGAQAATATIPAGSPGSVSTDPGGGPTGADPLVTEISIPPTAGGGTVALTEGSPSGTPPTGGYQFVGQQIDITSTAATSATNPLVIAFTVDENVIRASFGLGSTDPLPGPESVAITRTEGAGTPAIIPSCTSVGGGGGAIAPDPCVSSRSYVNGGTDLRAVVLTGAASKWNVAINPAAITVRDNGVSPRTATVAQGGFVVWSFTGAKAHTVTDLLKLGPSGAALFNSGSRVSGKFGYAFRAAGIYQFGSTAKGDGSAFTGTIAVPVVITPTSGSRATLFTVTWSTASISGYVFDSQYRYRKTGSKTWSAWKTLLSGATAPSATFSPSLGAGTYAVTARIRNKATGKAADWSPEIQIVVVP